MLERSHQWVSVLVYVGGRSLGPGGRVGSGRVRMIVMGLPSAGQGSSGSRGISMGLSVGLFPWLNQSRIMNCSQLAARALAASASISFVRVITLRLISRGPGVTMVGGGSGNVYSIGTLRPNRDSAIPIRGDSRSL